LGGAERHPPRGKKEELKQNTWRRGLELGAPKRDDPKRKKNGSKMDPARKKKSFAVTVLERWVEPWKPAKGKKRDAMLKGGVC